jgi:hypothetical protein
LIDMIFHSSGLLLVPEASPATSWCV